MKLKIDIQTREINSFNYSNLYVSYLKYPYHKINLNWLNEMTIFRK
jgi:hypothetical protein